MQWHKLADVQPDDGERVIVCRFLASPTWKEAVYSYEGSSWDRSNWHRAVATHPNDLWARVTLPATGGEG